VACAQACSPTSTGSSWLLAAGSPPGGCVAVWLPGYWRLLCGCSPECFVRLERSRCGGALLAAACALALRAAGCWLARRRSTEDWLSG
jgi:hypothetical protein